MRKDIQQNLRIRAGIDVPQIGVEQLLFQFRGVGQIAVMRQRNAIRRVHIHGLRFCGTGRPRSRIAHVADAYGALQTLHVIHLECITYQTIGLAQKQPASVRGCNACRVLSAVLKHGQGVIDAQEGVSLELDIIVGHEDDLATRRIDARVDRGREPDRTIEMHHP